MRSIQFILVSIIAIGTLSCNEKSIAVTDQLKAELDNNKYEMFVIEREIPNAGGLSSEELKTISQSSCDVIDQIGEEKIKWLHSYVTANKVYCVYSARDEAIIRQHADKGGFPANSVAGVVSIIDPGTASK